MLPFGTVVICAYIHQIHQRNGVLIAKTVSKRPLKNEKIEIQAILKGKMVLVLDFTTTKCTVSMRYMLVSGHFGYQMALSLNESKWLRLFPIFLSLIDTDLGNKDD